MNCRKIQRLVSLCIVLGLSAGWAHGEGLKEGDTLPDLGNFNLEGVLPDTGGKVILLDFWASWCGPCKISFPYLNAIHQEFSDKNFELIAVSQDDKASAMNRFLKKNPASFTVVRDANHELASTVRPEGMPTTLLIDAKGVIRHVHKGFHGEKTADQFRAWIQETLSP